MLRRFLPPLALLIAAPALAQDPSGPDEEYEEVSTSLDGVGRISIQGGWRYTSNETFYTNWYGRDENKDLERAQESTGGPLAVGSFAYAINDLVELGIDLFFTGGRLHLNTPDGEQTINTLSYGAAVGLRFQTVLPEVGPQGLVPFAGILTGPALTSSKRPGESIKEGTTQVWMGSLGATLRLSPRWGVTGEYRLAFLRGPVGPPENKLTFNTGGSWFTLGVTYSFPPEPSRPLPSGL
ncbi:outer membrane beta-barrel protein [Pyxidicoccus trucidator]|uniref:outer membrane beta-barrel protein n=1 Tax=Pyxidicoccus trucidator TaxID=2709662 RepID=UPI0019683BBD|nr:outer membrane beta-barrel protein [Pyxidicoccus trucidator]